MKPGEVHDKNGIPIYPGDVLRTFHYTHRWGRRKMYLFHVACLDGEHLIGVPASDLARKPDGGTFNLLPGNCSDIEIVQGYGPAPLMEFNERPRSKGKTNETQPRT
jgi:hypothetical protein